MANMKETYLNNREYSEEELEDIYEAWLENELHEKGLRGA